jgi:hypothetical protein
LFFACSLLQPVFGATTVGARDCGEWLNRKKNDYEELASNSWLTGYMSGISVMHELNGNKDNPLKKVNSAEQIRLWMDNYCQKNPLSNVFNGGANLFIELMQSK